MRIRALVLTAALMICVGCKDPPPSQIDAGKQSANDAAKSSKADLDASAGVALDASGSAITDASANEGGATNALPIDAGANTCRLIYGPQKMAFVGPAALAVEGADLLVVSNDLGKPRVVHIPISPVPPASAIIPELPRPASTFGAMWPPCVVAAGNAICPGRAGKITRTLLAGGATKEIVSGKPATRVSAAALGEHTVTAFLDEKQTTEGRTFIAFAVLDDGAPVRLSDDGSGATYVELATRGKEVIAMYLDARMSMVPIHARALSIKDGALDVGKDVVVAVGGAAERGVAGRIAISAKQTFFLIPMPEDALAFGMATIHLSEPPKEDEKMSWSLYPNGLDPAPVVATRGVTPLRIARVRPLEKSPYSVRALEIGTLADDGTFRADGLVTTGKTVTDLDIAADSFGATWLLYGDASDTWIERRICPP